MRSLLVLIGSAAVAVALPAPASAQLGGPEAGDLIFRRPIGGSTQTPGQVGLPTELTPELQTGLQGDTFGWSPYCLGGDAGAMCLSFPANGGPPGAASEAECLKSQNALHDAYLATQSQRYVGDASFLQKPGAAALLPSCSSDTIGHGYMCHRGQMMCSTVDRATYVLSGASLQDCLVPNQGGDFDRVLGAFGLSEPGPHIDPGTVCQAGPNAFYGRTESCTWAQSTANEGDRVMRLDERCFAVNASTLVATEVTLTSCRETSAAKERGPVVDELLRRASLLRATDPVALNCGQKDAGVLTSKIVSDVAGLLPDGRATRTIDYSFSCLAGGIPAPSSSCAGALFAWVSSAARFAEENALILEVESGTLSRREIYSQR